MMLGIVTLRSAYKEIKRARFTNIPINCIILIIKDKTIAKIIRTNISATCSRWARMVYFGWAKGLPFGICRILSDTVITLLLLLNSMQCVQAENHLGKHRQYKAKIKESLVIADSIREATVILVPIGISDAWYSEQELKREGCTFNTNDSNKIKSLINILNESNIKKAPKYKYYTLDDGTVINENALQSMYYNEGIYLTLTDKTLVKFLFKKPYTNAKYVNGIYSKPPKSNDQLVIANSNLIRELFFWTNNTGKYILSKEAIMDSRECELFMARKGYYKDIYKDK